MSDLLSKLGLQNPPANSNQANSKISGADKGQAANASTRASSFLAGQPLTPGRVVTATVLGDAPGGLIRIKLMGTTVLAESKVDLTPGQTVKLVVQETSPQVVLAMAGSEKGGVVRLPGLLQSVFQSNQTLAANLQTLLKFDLASLDISGKVRQAAQNVQQAAERFAADDPDPLRNAVKSAGLDYESRLAAEAKGQGDGVGAAARGLRPLIMALQRAMAADSGRAAAGGPHTAGLEVFAQAAAQVGEFFDSLAGLNAELVPRDSQLLLALAMLLDDELESGELLLDLPERGEKGGKEGQTSMVFFLKLTALGPLAIEAVLAGKSLKAEFVVDHPDKAEFINEHLGELAERLEAMGFEARLQAKVRPARQVEEASPLAVLIRKHGQYLSITV